MSCGVGAINVQWGGRQDDKGVEERSVGLLHVFICIARAQWTCEGDCNGGEHAAKLLCVYCKSRRHNEGVVGAVREGG